MSEDAATVDRLDEDAHSRPRYFTGLNPPSFSEINEAALDSHKAYIHKVKLFRNNLLSLGLPYVLVLLLAGALFASRTGFLRVLRLEYPFDLLFIGGAGAFLFIIFYYFRFGAPIRDAEKQLQEMQEEFNARLLRTSEGRWDSLYRQLRILTNDSARTFFENEERYNKAAEWRREAGKYLDEGYKTDLNEVQYLLTALKELIIKEQREQKNQNRWQYIAVLIILLYIFGLGYVTYIAAHQSYLGSIPIFGIPLWVVMWGATGSLAAILYRFYTEQNRVRLSSEVRWLIARPIIGIIMSAIAFLAVQSGLILLGAQSASTLGSVQSSEVNVITNSTRIAAIICFLAGFSDRVYLGIINLLVDRAFGSEQGSQKSSLAEEKSDESASTICGKFDINGLWLQEQEVDGVRHSYQIFLRQVGQRLKGAATIVKLGNGKYDDVRTFTVSGSVSNASVVLVLTCKNGLDHPHAVMSLRIKDGGMKLEGELAYENEKKELGPILMSFLKAT